MNIRSVFQDGIEVISKQSSDFSAVVYILSQKNAAKRATALKKIVTATAPAHLTDKLLKSDKKMIHYSGQSGQVWILQPADAKSSPSPWAESDYAYWRDQGAHLYSQIKAQSAETVCVEAHDADTGLWRALFIGMVLAGYNFLSAYKDSESKKALGLAVKSYKNGKLQKISKDVFESAAIEARAVQLARHLVNLPPNDVNPETVELLIKTGLDFNKKGVKIEVWDHQRLARENMNLHLAVGKGSATPPRMVHIKWRPGKNVKKAPIAFVGKGITFDTGGLDIKPSSAMRLMKKDMGGAAAVLGIAYWAVHSNYSRPCDFYLALAENCVDANSMRPSDLYKSRAGFVVEIDNTDAEGRLVLADVMDVAAKQKGSDEPEILIDLATLTGAIKVALGADVAGLFCNDDRLAKQIFDAGASAGEPNWRMPLVHKYFSSLSSHFADFKNSGEGFGGAITAALFLEKFCAGKKWAHLDIYSWTDKAQGPFMSAGANGQPVQSMIAYLKSQA